MTKQLSATVFDLMDLKHNHCRWPIGDPARDGFGFCGRERESEKTFYCPGHRSVSIDHTKKKPSSKELARSVRQLAHRDSIPNEAA